MDDKEAFIQLLRDSLGNGDVGDLIGDIHNEFSDPTQHYVPVTQAEAEKFFSMIADAVYG